MRGYRDLAAELRRRIESDEFPVGSTLPTIKQLMEEYHLQRQTVRAAINKLAMEGLVKPIRRRGTIVRDRSPIRIPLSRYSGALRSSDKGPWEQATTAQGLNGSMRFQGVEHQTADEQMADALGIEQGADVVYRIRHAMIGDEVVQIQHAWYPAELAHQAGLDEAEKIEGGVFARLTESGEPPQTIDEVIRARMPSEDEATLLQTGVGVPLLVVERITKGGGGHILELLRVIAPADRIELTYDQLPLDGGSAR